MREEKRMSTLYSNEIVFRGHPDKVCDQISGAILNRCLELDPGARVGVEVVGGKSYICITGEITTKEWLSNREIDKIVHRVLKACGYKDTYDLVIDIGQQSADIALGTNDEVGGAGDQGMMFGYATNETEELLPLAQVILQEFAQWYEINRQESDDFLSDGKAQITGYYNEDMKLERIKTFLVSYQNTEKNRANCDAIIKAQIKAICGAHGVEVDEILINPTGRFEIGGFQGDAGLTGRKIVVDAYQSFANVGGGCMNGKDPTKVDVSGAYFARWIACQEVKKNNRKWVEVQVAYSIGKPEPLSIHIDSDQGAIEPAPEYYKLGAPRVITENLHLKELDWEKQAQFGHFRKAL